MPTEIHPQTCRTCVHWVSEPGAGGRGVCSNEASPAAFDLVFVDDCCREHDPRQTGELEGHVLYQRRCLHCGHVNIYSAGYGGDAWCARCA